MGGRRDPNLSSDAVGKVDVGKRQEKGELNSFIKSLIEMSTPN